MYNVANVAPLYWIGVRLPGVGWDGYGVTSANMPTSALAPNRSSALGSRGQT